MPQMPSIDLKPGQELDGFRVTRVTPLPELYAVAIELEHGKSGARVLHLAAEDPENLFAIAFPTPPPDDRGVPHILEHSVLGGSERFPVKEPFFEMVKMSMATYINALTSDALTVYPVSSNVRQDYYNLAEVYWDAVFHPTLTREVFEREGHHLALKDNADPASGLMLKGIVYNEMKGAYSSPERMLWRELERALLPDSPLGLDAGGDPDHIPDLTYEDFVRFHHQLYQPGNAYILLYGDLPTRDQLAFLAPRLARFEGRAVETKIERQPRWNAPRSLTVPYPIGPDEPAEERTFITLHWLIGDRLAIDETVAIEVLDTILTGNEGAPLKKAIIDSRLGTDITFTGQGNVSLEASFHIGVKGSEPERVAAFEELVVATLETLADQPFSAQQIESAFQQMAYHHREIQSGYPMRMLWGVLETWVHGEDPLRFLRIAERLEACRERWLADPLLFNRLIRERLLDNPHRLTLTLVPDREVAAEKEAARAAVLAAREAELSAEQLAAIGQAAAELERKQGLPNPPEALALLPQLKVSDLPAEAQESIATQEVLPGGITLLVNDVFSNGVNYLHLAIDLGHLPPGLMDDLPCFTTCFSRLGAAGLDYTATAARVAESTGGVSCWSECQTHAVDATRTLRHLRISMKFLDGRAGEALGLLRDLIFRLDLDRERERLRDLLAQMLTHIKTDLVNDAASTGVRRAARGLSPVCWLGERMGGLPELARLRTISEAFDAQADGLIARMETIRAALAVRGTWTASFTGSDAMTQRVRAELSAWGGDLAAPGSDVFAIAGEPYTELPCEGLAAALQVCYCAMAQAGPHDAHPDAALLKLASRFLSLDYMLAEVRFKGNAYGAAFAYNALEGIISWYSYRDPRLLETLEVFRAMPSWVERATWTQADVDRAIIGAAKSFHEPVRPAAATTRALRDFIRGRDHARRQADYAAILAATPAAVKQVVARHLPVGLPDAAVCVVASRERLEQANAAQTGCTFAIRDILG